MQEAASEPRTFNRDLSWLSFNGRVLQEADDPTLPLQDRLDFLAIFSSNLDEFFRVRVAALRTILRIKKKTRKEFVSKPRRLLKEIHTQVQRQQEHFGEIFSSQIVPGLAAHNIYLVDEAQLPDHLVPSVLQYFEEHLREIVETHELGPQNPGPFLEDRALYLVSELRQRSGRDVGPSLGLTRIPDYLPRFCSIPNGDRWYVLFLDDVLRVGLPTLFPDAEVGRSFSIKLSRDADLNLEDEFSGDLIGKIRKALSRRPMGPPSRFLYDQHTPKPMIDFLLDTFSLSEDDMVPGGRYHNLHDLRSFPNFGLDSLRRPSLRRLQHPFLFEAPSLFKAIREGDHLIHTPYQSFEPVLRFVEEAAADPDVTSLSATLYRVASRSRIVEALIKAAARGADVTVFVEVKARFDEAHNLECAARMEAAGVQIIYSIPGLKVHAKLLLAVRTEDNLAMRYTYIGTGNLNESTSEVYADHGLFTAEGTITSDVARIFAFLQGQDPDPTYEKLLVAPNHLRRGLEALIEQEVNIVSEGGNGRIVLKMNSLQDPEVIDQLYTADQSGVQIRLIIRGICCLRPNVENLSDHIFATSIVDRFLEHARVFLFGQDGKDRLYIASADIMERNLDRRIEVACPIEDPLLKEELKHILALQMAATRKARILDADQTNGFVRAVDSEAPSAQEEIHAYLAGL